MSSKRNHAARSRKTHRWNMIGARAMRGSLPYELRMDMSMALRQIRAAKAAPHDDKEQKEET